MIRRELELPPRLCSGQRAGHDAGVVDEQVERAVIPKPVFGTGAHAGKRIQLELHHVHHAAGRCPDALRHPFALGHVAHCEGDRRAPGGQGPGRLGAEPAGGPGDQRRLAGEVDALKNLFSSGVVSKSHAADSPGKTIQSYPSGNPGATA